MILTSKTIKELDEINEIEELEKKLKSTKLNYKEIEILHHIKKIKRFIADLIQLSIELYL